MNDLLKLIERLSVPANIDAFERALLTIRELHRTIDADEPAELDGLLSAARERSRKVSEEIQATPHNPDPEAA